MSMNNEKAEKPQAPFPQPGKNTTGDPAQAAGKRRVEREDVAAPTDEDKDASGAAKDSEPQQSRELRRNQH
jgi:hypothetical protein